MVGSTAFWLAGFGVALLLTGWACWQGGVRHASAKFADSLTKATKDLQKRLADADKQIAKVRDQSKAQLSQARAAIKRELDAAIEKDRQKLLSTQAQLREAYDQLETLKRNQRDAEERTSTVKDGFAATETMRYDT